jgi:hypothetical protein
VKDLGVRSDELKDPVQAAEHCKAIRAHNLWRFVHLIGEYPMAADAIIAHPRTKVKAASSDELGETLNQIA